LKVTDWIIIAVTVTAALALEGFLSIGVGRIPWSELPDRATLVIAAVAGTFHVVMPVVTAFLSVRMEFVRTPIYSNSGEKKYDLLPSSPILAHPLPARYLCGFISLLCFLVMAHSVGGISMDEARLRAAPVIASEARVDRELAVAGKVLRLARGAADKEVHQEKIDGLWRERASFLDEHSSSARNARVAFPQLSAQTAEAVLPLFRGAIALLIAGIVPVIVTVFVRWGRNEKSRMEHAALADYEERRTRDLQSHWFDMFVPAPGHHLTKRQAVEVYTTWCKSRSVVPMHETPFFRALAERAELAGWRDRRVGGKPGYIDIGIRSTVHK
jgi:hypothetical protein